MIEPMALIAGALMHPAEDCRTIADFGDPAEAARWYVVNDGVMGGRSRGGLERQGSALLFAGDINTDGGGFSSIRRDFDAGLLTGTRSIQVLMKSDGRDYQLTLRSDATWRGRPIAFRAPLTFDARGPDGWRKATVSYDMLEPSLFGRRVPAPDFDPAMADSIGLIIADGKDGPFKAVVRSIRAC